MKNYTIDELIIAINSCATLKEFVKKFKLMYYFIHYHHLLYLFDGIYFYDKMGLVQICYDLYGDKYDLTEFLTNGIKYSTLSNTTLIPVLCKKHGRVLIPIKDMLSGVGCHKCVRDVRNEIRCAFTNKRPHRNVLLEQVHEISNNTITIHSFEEYKNLRGLVEFTCVYHGDFHHKISSFLDGGGKCPYCLLIDKISLILKVNGVSNTIRDGVVYLESGKSVGVNGCDINISLVDNVYDVLSSNGLIYADKNTEDWLPIDGYSNYLINSLGVVKNIKTNKLLRGCVNNNNRVVVGLKSDDGVFRSFSLHRLVYVSFNGLIHDGENVDHIDGNPLNNRLSNLRVCKNIKENINNEITIISSKINAYLRRILNKDSVKPNYDGKGVLDIYTKESNYLGHSVLEWTTKTCYNLHAFKETYFKNNHQPSDECHWCRTDFSNIRTKIVYDKIYIKHYITKSWEEYISKRKRGYFMGFARTIDMFFRINQDMLPLKQELLDGLNKETLVVLPYKQSGSQGNEIRIALNGWRKFCQFNYRFVVIGEFDEQLKDEFPWVKFIECPTKEKKEGQYNPHLDIQNKFNVVSRMYSQIYNGFIYMSDDKYAIKPFNLDDITKTRYHALEFVGNEKAPKSYWSYDKWKTRQLLDREGLPHINYTTHYPCYFEFKKLEEIRRKYNLLEDSYVFDDLYFNYFKHEEPILDSTIRLGIWNNNIFKNDFQKAVDDPNIKFICNSVEGWSKELEDELKIIIKNKE